MFFFTLSEFINSASRSRHDFSVLLTGHLFLKCLGIFFFFFFFWERERVKQVYNFRESSNSPIWRDGKWLGGDVVFLKYFISFSPWDFFKRHMFRIIIIIGLVSCEELYICFSFHNNHMKKFHSHSLFTYWRLENFKPFAGVLLLVRHRAEVWIQVCPDFKSLYLNYWVILQLNCFSEVNYFR